MKDYPESEGMGELRQQMVAHQLRERGISDERVLEAFTRVPRHAFVPEEVAARSYADAPLPIGEGQTISQPYIVGLMTEALQLDPGDRVLEVGTGSGYQAAILAAIGVEVFTIESVETLASRARVILDGLGFDNIRYKTGNGRLGWPEEAPFDGIIVTAAPAGLPQALPDQLKRDGRLVIPFGRFEQTLYRITRREDGLQQERLCAVRFVPLTGKDS